MGGVAHIAVKDENETTVIVGRAVGSRARVRQEVLDGLNGERLGEGLGGHWVQAFYLRSQVDMAGGAVEVEVADGEVTLRDANAQERAAFPVRHGSLTTRARQDRTDEEPHSVKTCLVVDDSRVIRKVARRILEDLGFETAEAADGVEAMAWCRTTMPEAILLDWNMPVMERAGIPKAAAPRPRRRTGRWCCSAPPRTISTTSPAPSRPEPNEYIMKPFDGDIISRQIRTRSGCSYEAGRRRNGSHNWTSMPASGVITCRITRPIQSKPGWRRWRGARDSPTWTRPARGGCASRARRPG